ncbi:MAG: flagellar motor protein MotB [Alphaproteobacteria bacterium]
MANQFLSLSLFLMLLSFFIVLNAVSDPDEHRSQSVMNSLSMTFSNEDIPADASPSFDVSDILNKKREGDTLEALEGVFNAHISGFEAKRNRLGSVMHVRVPVGRFENAIDFPSIPYSEVAIGTRGAFLPTMVTMLRSENGGQPYRMDMVLNVPQEPALYLRNNAKDFQDDLKLISDFALSIERAGMPKKMISAGMAKGDPSYMDLYFYRYKVFDLAQIIKRNGERDE